MSLWDVSGKAVVSANAQDYLSRNLGWSLNKNRDIKSIAALTDPKQFVIDRQTEVDTIVTKKVQPYFEERLKEFYELGLPDDVSKELALKQASRIYQDQLEMLEIGAPNAYKQAFGLGNLQRENMNAAYDIATVEKNAVRAYKKKKRAAKK